MNLEPKYKDDRVNPGSELKVKYFIKTPMKRMFVVIKIMCSSIIITAVSLPPVPVVQYSVV